MPSAEQIPLDVLFEDPWLLAVNKPPGIVVHPSYRNVSGTLLNGILAHRFLNATPGIVTRLDKNTSGVVLVALTSQAHRATQRLATGGGVHKEYLAIVRGAPSPVTGTIDLPLARDPVDRRRVVVAAAGAASRTDYLVLAQSGDFAAVSCRLVTGRTHQIRVHLAACGWPVAGDPTYGCPHPSLARQALHSWRLALPHPLTGHPLSIAAPVPADLLHAFPDLLERHVV